MSPPTLCLLPVVTFPELAPEIGVPDRDLTPRTQGNVSADVSGSLGRITGKPETDVTITANYAARSKGRLPVAARLRGCAKVVSSAPS